MRDLILSALAAVLMASPAAVAAGSPGDGPQIAVGAIAMADPHTLRVDVSASGLGAADADPSTVDLSVWLDGVPARAQMPLIHMPPQFAMDFDLPAGVIRVAGVRVGTFQPVPRFSENMRFLVEVTVRRGPLTATAHRDATLLLPTIIVPGYSNEHSGPDQDVLAAFARHGYTSRGPAPTVFWWSYSSHRITVEDGARDLAAFVRRTVLPHSYAARVNVVAYSVGGLLARWNVEYDVDGWGTLVNRLALVGVPNEGAVMPYIGAHALSFLPFVKSAKTLLAQTMIPTFPFWRATPSDPWAVPADASNSVLSRLNERAIPGGIRVSIFYGSHNPLDPAGPQTEGGITGQLPGARLSFEDGDGIVTAASALGLPFHGGSGVPGLADRAVLRTNLGSVYHSALLEAGADKIAAAMVDRFYTTVDHESVWQCCPSLASVSSP
jgi:hypothetical protein